MNLYLKKNKSDKEENILKNFKEIILKNKKKKKYLYCDFC
jgi:hypothetical protein